MAIRVERSISDEGDGQENRIAASSAKCKGNKAGWSFYQGQGVAVLLGLKTYHSAAFLVNKKPAFEETNHGQATTASTYNRFAYA